MKTAEFCYWLMGFFELDGSSELDAVQTKLVASKLNSLFLHEAAPTTEKSGNQGRARKPVGRGRALERNVRDNGRRYRC